MRKYQFVQQRNTELYFLSLEVLFCSITMVVAQPYDSYHLFYLYYIFIIILFLLHCGSSIQLNNNLLHEF